MKNEMRKEKRSDDGSTKKIKLKKTSFISLRLWQSKTVTMFLRSISCSVIRSLKLLIVIYTSRGVKPSPPYKMRILLRSTRTESTACIVGRLHLGETKHLQESLCVVINVVKLFGNESILGAFDIFTKFSHRWVFFFVLRIYALTKR